MTKTPVSTRDQLRALIHTHAENVVAVPVSSAPPVEKIRQVMAPPVNPTKPKAPSTLPRVLARQSLRLLPWEFDKINVIINNTIQRTGSRATVTDVLRAGLAKLEEFTHISIEELKSLRASDRRRVSE